MRPSRKLIARSVLVLAGFLAGAAIGAPLPTLAELEDRLDGSLELQVLDSDVDVAARRLQLQRRGFGASLYSQATFADNDEVVDVGRTRSYRQLNGGMGVRVPVLGSRMQWQEAVARDELGLSRTEADRNLRRRELLKELRSSYAMYWASQRLEALSRDYLAAEPVLEQQLLMRTRAGLLLDSDRLEFMSGFAMARRDQLVAQAEQKRALGSMRQLVHGNLEAGAAARPTVAMACAPGGSGSESAVDQWSTRALDTHPELAYLREASRRLQLSPRNSVLYDVRSDIRVGYHTSTEWPTQERGGSAAVTWSFEMPIDMMGRNGLARSAASAERSRAELEYERRRAQIEQDVQTLVGQRPVLEQSLQFARVRAASAEGAVRERELRSVKLAGDVIERLQQARLARYGAQKALIDAELAMAQWSAEWALLAPVDCRSRALYVWSSASIITQLSHQSAASVTEAARDAGVTHLFLSLDSAQLEQYARNPEPLRAALDAAHERGLRVDLLLGEPTWLLENRRNDLLSIIRRLSALPFDGLHLDIEPNQLENSGLDESALLASLVDTVRAVRAMSAWPVDVSVHPRYLTKLAGTHTLGDALSDADVTATLMVYVANPERVREIVEPLLSRFPRLAQRVALSLEDTLGRDESLHSYSPEERAKRVSRVESGLSQANFRGIALQPSVGAVFSTPLLGN
jgi:outer membrane protein TolC